MIPPKENYGNQQSMEQMQAAEMKKKQQAEMRSSMLGQILTPEASERLARIGLVKPDKVRQVEDSVIQMAQNRQLASQLTENQLISMLEQGPASGKKVERIHKKSAFRDDEDDDIDDDDNY